MVLDIVSYVKSFGRPNLPRLSKSMKACQREREICVWLTAPARYLSTLLREYIVFNIIRNKL